jgi:metallo-beta-lactamase class B
MSSMAPCVISMLLATGACRGEAPAGAAPAAESEAAEPPFEVTELAPDVLVVTTRPFAANSLLVRTVGGRIILVDTPTTPAATATLLDWIRDRWGAYPHHAIASHWHADASGGNQVLVERGVETISSIETARLVESRGERGRDALVAMFAERDPELARDLQALQPLPATRQVDVKGRVSLVLGGENVELVFPGPSHSADSLGIFFPERKLLYGGCAVRSDGRIIDRSEADAGWARALEVFAALEPETVVPGHGKRFDPGMIAESIEAVRALARSRRPATPKNR